jgi:hypothetical protein
MREEERRGERVEWGVGCISDCENMSKKYVNEHLCGRHLDD